MADERTKSIREELESASTPIAVKMRNVFTLENLNTVHAREALKSAFLADRKNGEGSVLLRHEIAYALGQMQTPDVIDFLVSILSDSTEDGMVRHEAGEALGAIGDPVSLSALSLYAKDPVKEVAETCQLALDRIAKAKEDETELFQSIKEQKAKLEEILRRNREENGEEEENEENKDEENIDTTKPVKSHIFNSVDPAPSFAKRKNIEELKKILLDENLSMYERYRAMFSLRDMNTKESTKALCAGLNPALCPSALFRHEVCYVLGQMQNQYAIDTLKERLADVTEHAMVRHEAAEALGSCVDDEGQVRDLLGSYLGDNVKAVRESVVVALDICDYNQSDEFQYANGLAKQI